MRFSLLIVLLLGLLVSTAHGWGAKQHIQLTRIAAERLIADPATPPEMKAWLKSAAGPLLDMDGERQYFMDRYIGRFPRGADGLAFYSVVPDLLSDTDRQQIKLPYFGTTEKRLHHFDMEIFNADESKRSYADDLSHKPRLEDFPRDVRDIRYQSAGVLPFAIEVFYQRMVGSIRDGRLVDKLGQLPRADHAAYWAGCLAHYVEDNTQPQHATVDFRSRLYFKPGLRLPDVHADFEYRLGDDPNDDHMELRREFWGLFVKALDEVYEPVQTGDLWKSTIEVSRTSYDALPMIGRGAVAAYPEISSQNTGPWKAKAFFHYRGRYLGRDMTVLEMQAHQLAWAVHRVEAIWRRAWIDATGNQPARP